MGHRQDCSSSLREELEQAQERASEPPIHEIRPFHGMKTMSNTME